MNHFNALSEHTQATLYGLFIGDALAMPVHWYYDPSNIEKTFGTIRDYVAPKAVHPESILWRSQYKSLNRRGDILHDQGKYWGQHHVHYHQFLEAGENTVNLQLCNLQWQTLVDNQGWDTSDYLKRYIQFMTTPGMHKDTYLEESHRGFFTHYAQGRAPKNCSVVEKHIGGLACLFPSLAYYESDIESGKRYALERLSATHKGPVMEDAAALIIKLYEALCAGSSPREAATDLINTQCSPLIKGNWSKWIQMPTREVLTRRVGTVCYVQAAVPAIIYLLLKHGEHPENALIENTMAGGDNAYRGAVLGALLGRAQGMSAWPKRWIDGLKIKDSLA